MLPEYPARVFLDDFGGDLVVTPTLLLRVAATPGRTPDEFLAVGATIKIYRVHGDPHQSDSSNSVSNRDRAW